MSANLVRVVFGMKNATKLVSRKNGTHRGAVRAHRIIRLQVEGGFLDGLTLDFAPDLNCLIGGRGAGKTTTFEILRWALKGFPLDACTGQEKRDYQRLLQENLGDGGKVRVLIETKNGIRYTVERTIHGEPRVLDEAGVLMSFQLTQGAIFDMDVYSQNEIERIAESPVEQLALLDRLCGRELRDVQDQLRGVRHQLQDNTHLIQGLTKEVKELDEAVAELPAVEEKLATSRAQGPAGDPSGVEAATLETGLRERETRAVDAVQQFLRTQRETLASLKRGLAGGPHIPQGVARGPNRAVFAEIAAALASAGQDAQGPMGWIEAALEGAQDAVRASRTELEKLHKQQDQRYRELMAANERERERAQEQLEYERQLVELQEKQRVREEKGAALTEALATRKRLREDVSRLRDDRFSLRQREALRLSEQLDPQIDIQISQGADRSAFRNVLAAAFKGTGKPYQQLVADVADKFTPTELVTALAAQKPVAAIQRHLGSESPDRLAWFVEQLKDTVYPAQAESVDLEDVPEIQLKDGKKWKPARDLSIGQKCTAILPLLLIESDRPLCLDQPEDNLDNAFVFETVVSRLREVKAHRQLILVTHNPNIPVLGDASKVFVLRSDGQQARLLAHGTVDEVREEVARLLEGGRAAFQARRERYGY